MARNNIQIVGGERSGEFIEWLGARARIQGVWHSLNRVRFIDGSTREYYVASGICLQDLLPDVESIEERKCA